MLKVVFPPDPGWDCENYEVFGWPRITVDKIEGRQWIHPTPPRYYLSRSNTGTWAVVDRSIDLAITRDYRTQTAAIRAFFRQLAKSLADS
jgi:hypothetical protein